MKGLQNKISVKRQRIYGVVMSYAVLFTHILTGLLYTPIILRTLGQSEYGIYSLTLSCMGYLTIFDSGMNAAFVRFYVQTKEKNRETIPKLNGLFLKIFFMMAVLAVLLGLFLSTHTQEIFGMNIRPEEYPVMERCLRLLSMNAGIVVMNCVFTSLIVANERFVFGKAVNLLSAVLTPVLTIPMLFKGYGAAMVLFIKLSMDGLTCLLNVMFCIRILKVRFDLGKENFLMLKSILMFAGAIVVQQVIDQFNWQIDKFILGRVRGTKEISIYSVGSYFNQYYIMLTGALSGVFIAKINRLEANKSWEKINSLFQKTSRMFAFAVFWIMTGFIFFGKPFILRWAGTEYGESYYVGLLIMLPVTVSLTQRLGQDIARAKNRHMLQIIINSVVSLLNVLLSIPLASRYGAVGSAFGTFIAEIAICIIIQAVYYQTIIGLDMRAYFKDMRHMLKGLVIPVMFGVFLLKVRCVKTNYVSIFVYGALYTAVYGISMWFISTEREEKEQIRRAVKQKKAG